MQTDERRAATCVARTESGAALTAERLAARPVDTFTNDGRNVIGISDLSGKSIPPWFLSRLARHNASRFFGAANERDQNTLSDLFSARAHSRTGSLCKSLFREEKRELMSGDKLR